MRSWRRWVSIALVGVPMMAAEWKDRYAEVNGVKLHYVEEGKGPLVLFLHGFPEFWYEWKSLLPDFGKDHHAVAVDMRGYNLSDKPEKVEAYAVPTIVEDVRALAAKLGAKKFVLVGHDWGGVIAWAFAGAHPEMLEKLIIINAPHPTLFSQLLAKDPAQQKASSYFNLFTSPAAEGALGGNNFQVITNMFKTWASEEDLKAYLESWKHGLTGGLNYYRAANLHSPVDGSKEMSAAFNQPLMISTPTLVIWGEKDTALLTSNLDGMEKYVKHLQVERVADAGHWVVHEKPALVIATMRKFLKS